MRKAFSLIELMIVIVIVGVVYTLAVTKLKSVGDEKLQPNFLNLKEYLLLQVEDAKEIELICLDDCSTCSIYGDGEKRLELKSWFDDSVERYKYDSRDGLIPLENPVFFNAEDVQESVCFSFKINTSAYSEQLILLYKDKVYDYTDYFNGTKVYMSVEEIVDAKERLKDELQ